LNCLLNRESRQTLPEAYTAEPTNPVEYVDWLSGVCERGWSPSPKLPRLTRLSPHAVTQSASLMPVSSTPSEPINS